MEDRAGMMEEAMSGSGTEAAVQSRLEQVDLNMPEAVFYFSSEKEQAADTVKAYIGGEELSFDSLGVFSEGSTPVSYYLLLDVSASVSETEFQGITGALESFSRTVRPQDRVQLISFGEEVRTVFDFSGEELAGGAASGSFQELANRDQRTLLFEALSQTVALASEQERGAQERCRQVAFVITDGEDIARGKTTQDEALKLLTEEGLPVYGFAPESAKREAVNAFGAFSRETGGDLAVLEAGSEADAFYKVREEILSSYEAVFHAGNNLVSNGMVSVTLELSDGGEACRLQMVQDRWRKDMEAPGFLEAADEGAGRLRLTFTEPVSGAEAAGNYALEKDGISLTPIYASAESDGRSVVLTFPEELQAGEYQLSCKNIFDVSMEKNPLEETLAVTVDAASAGNAAETAPVRDAGGIGKTAALGAVLLAILLLAAFWAQRRKKAAAGNGNAASAGTVTEEKPVMVSPAECRHHVSMETRKWEEKAIRVHVAGQKEELSLTIKNSMIVGRSSACELIFDDPSLSRQHFALEVKGGQILIQNLSQSGQTTVNGRRLGTESRLLQPGDEIGAGQLKLTVRW